MALVSSLQFIQSNNLLLPRPHPLNTLQGARHSKPTFFFLFFVMHHKDSIFIHILDSWLYKYIYFFILCRLQNPICYLLQECSNYKVTYSFTTTSLTLKSVCVRESVRVCVWERVCICVCERERESVCVCLCMWERAWALVCLLIVLTWSCIC